MFGESDSESPRQGSPWDSLMSTSSSPSSFDGIPKLIPEVEEGNVEYKLKLINPSPDRFARLVTQLKWRLLEGGGQALYELGVADSGQLVGLSTTQLEQSLQTLEEMAGEIGASVIVVKEIEVPVPFVDTSGTSARGFIDGAMRLQRKYIDSSPVEDAGGGMGPLNTGCTDATTPEMTDYSDGETTGPGAIDDDYPVVNIDFDSDTAVTDNFSFDLEIASVYKPRPTRRRAHVATLRDNNRRRNKINASNKNSTNLTPHYAIGVLDNGSSQLLLKVGSTKASAKSASTTKPYSSESDSFPAIFVQSDVHAEGDRAKLGVDVLVSKLEVISLDATAQALDLKDDITASGQSEGEERLRIVEALVVRKMSLDEAFLDFGGFGL